MHKDQLLDVVLGVMMDLCLLFTSLLVRISQILSFCDRFLPRFKIHFIFPIKNVQNKKKMCKTNGIKAMAFRSSLVKHQQVLQTAVDNSVGFCVSGYW